MVSIFNYKKRNRNVFLLSHHFLTSQKDYVCFDFVPRHHNIIRYRKGLAVIKDDFSHVCSWVQFPNKEEWRYDLYLGRCFIETPCKIKRKMAKFLNVNFS